MINSKCEGRQPIQITCLEKHSSLEGNDNDSFYYQFATNRSLKGLPARLVEDALSKAINEVVHSFSRTIE